MTYVIVEATDDSKVGIKLYGAAREFWSYKGHEVMLAGPYETGKTIGTLLKLHLLLCKYGGSRALMVRKTYKSLRESAVVTYENKILPYPPGHLKSAIDKYGGEKPEFYAYPNNSRLVCGGLDDPSKVLSSEYDFIYVNQAEELILDEWEALVGRATGRAGNAPYPQIMADCNPGPPTHWIIHRSSLKVFEQRHEHNPTLFNQETGVITEQGKRTLAILDNLTGVRKKRGRHGLWVAAEGQVYDDFDPEVHVIKQPFIIPPEWKRYRSIDFGFTNPFVCQWWAEDGDGRLYLYREIYMTRKTVQQHAPVIRRLGLGENILHTVADHDAEDRATLRQHGIDTRPAMKDISRGIQAVQERLKVQPDGKPRLFIVEHALVEADTHLFRQLPGDLYPVSTEQEFSSYVWPTGVDGKSNKEVPVDAWNHGMDALRYMVADRDLQGSRAVVEDAAPLDFNSIWDNGDDYAYYDDYEGDD
jgi:PBSX family phage terminase large subunit